MSVVILLLKHNPWHDPLGRFAYAPSGGRGGGRNRPEARALPPSRGISTLAEAEEYWRTHFAGRTFHIEAREQARQGKTVTIRVFFPPEATHAFTRGHRDRDFDPARAQAMDRIPRTLADPMTILEEREHHLWIARRENDAWQLVALRWNGGNGRYEFASSYPLDRAALRRLERDGARASFEDTGAPMRKALPANIGAPDSAVRVCGIPPVADWPTPVRPSFEDAAHAIPYMRELAPLFKAASIPEGARWITVRPNGPGTEGHPVLIQPHPSGRGYSVVGGAGGKLNYLHLTGVRSESEYAQRAKETAAARRQQRKERAKRDREAGLTNPKTAARERLSVAAQAAREDFVRRVAEALAWKPEDTRFNEEDHQDKPPSEVKRLAEEHFGKLYTVAKEAVAAQRARILADAQMRDAVDIATEPHPDRPEAITVADLDPVANDTPRGLGFQPKYDERAAAAGATPDDIRAEAATVSPKPKPEPEPEAPKAEQPALPGTDAAQPEKNPAIAEKTGEALATIREPIGPRVDPKAKATAKAAMEVLKAERELAAKLKEVRTRAKEIEKADRAEDIEPTAFVLEVAGKPVTDADVMRSVEDDLRTIRTRGFLSAAQEAGAQAITKHVAIGAYNSVNALALAAGGNALLDRSVVDVLGPAAAAQALAHRLAMDLSPEELANVTEAMGRFHVEHYMARSEEALAEARDLQEQAAEINLGEVANGGDLAVAQELNQRRREMVNRSKAILAQALGEMETNAAIVTALEKPKRDRITVPMGDLTPTDAITRLRAIGLERGDYTIERAGPNTITVIQPAGIAKLTQPIEAEDIQRVNAALAIMRGDQDEDDWLPGGVADRPDFGRDAPLGMAPRLAEAFPSKPPDIAQAVRDYVGGRMADGDAPADILAGLLSEDVMQRAGDRAAFLAAVDEVAPLYGADGKMIRVEQHAAAFEALADAFVKERYGMDRAPLHRQRVAEDEKTVEALHRALAGMPEGMIALRPVADLTTEDQRAVRDFFAREFGHTDPLSREKRDRLAALDAQEPEKEADGLFGRDVNPEWTRWKQERDAAAQEAAGAEFTWPRYVEAMGGPTAAYQAMQDTIRGRLIDSFAREHNRLRPDAPLRTGRTVIRGDLEHLSAIDPAARAKRQEEHAAMVDRLRNRVGGKYAAGSVADKIAATRAAEEAAAQAQMGLFGAEPEAPAGEKLPENTAPLGPGERVTVGAAAERALAGIAARTGRMWRPGEPAKLYKPTMSGRFIGRQRAVKLIQANKRMVLGMGVGSGKTSISLAAFTHLKEQGKAKRGLFLVPSVVQGQFHTEALSLLKPGAYSWHAKPGASREERIAAMKDGKHDFAVFTHQSFRDDVLHLAAEQAGVDPATMGDRLAAMTPEQRAEHIHDTLAKAGIEFDYLAVDEGHNLLNRQGKANSRMADVVDSVSARMGHYVNMTADPVKNDASEVFDLLRKMDPARYQDRDAFMRRYGVDTDAARDGLRRELARHAYTASIDPGVRATRKEVPVSLHADDAARVSTIQRAAGALRLARLEGRTDIAAARDLSPGSFEGVPPEQHEQVARKIADALGVVRDAAMRHAINGKGKEDAISRLAAERKGKPGVIFCHHLEQVKALEARLKAEGHRVITMTGAHSAKEKDRIKRDFTRGDHHILIASDAGLVGANLQAGKWLAQLDTPLTAMAHAQRNGRIHRIGQTEDVELFDLLADHPAERIARDRLARKYGLRDIVTSPLDSLDDTGLAGMLRRIRTERAERADPPAEKAAA